MSNKYYLLMRHKLHWLEMTDGIEFPIAVIMYSGIAPEYLTELCSPVIGRSSMYTFWSANSNQTHRSAC